MVRGRVPGAVRGRKNSYLELDQFLPRIGSIHPYDWINSYLQLD